ncbi:oxidoreductase [Devosia yakushimensis]|uniref:Oxidoreductase n=1 Tax=Devosia yakushimensis TaxID=470028 RepID=A0ABQ5U993_9HYPH|nr:NADP-dependent oxidoreductase [Devosia yakushimensis]GLQ08715.1 oxidoreductase [Devosia yakushimensis]
MRAARFATFGGPEVLSIDEIATPEPAAGEVRVRIRAAAIQPFDRRARIGDIPLPPGMSLPLTTGNEFAGVVDALGEGTTGFAIGDRVAGRRTFGAVADYIAVAATDIALIPAELSFAEAATMGGTAQTADAVMDALAIGPGDIFLINGAAGGVGSFAGQLARLRGATVIGTASPANQDYLRSLGMIALPYGEGLAQRLAAAAPNGVTAVLDCAGGEALDLSMTLGAPLDRITSIADPRAKALGIRGIEGTRSGARVAKLFALAASGQLKPQVRRTYPMDQIVAAHNELETGHGHGKIVIEISP